MRNRNLPNRSQNFAGNSPRETGPASTAGSKPRQRRWTPKVKTGCLTCRIRRIKCDEVKPFCTRCTSTGRRCDGYSTDATSSQRDSVTSSELASIPRRVPMTSRASSMAFINVNPDPPDWDFAEACKYYDHFIYAAQMSNELAPTSYYIPPSDVKLHCKHPFIMYVIAHRISCISKVHGHIEIPHELPSLAHLWSIFYHGVAASITNINAALSSSDAVNQPWIFIRIVDVLSVELWLLGVDWRAHTEGFMALIRLTGGVSRSLQVGDSQNIAMNYVLIAAAMANTTSPATNQIKGIAVFKTSDIYNVYSTAMYPDLPCPTQIFLEINRITRLRVLIQTEACSPHDAGLIAGQIYRRIDSFNPEEWNERYSLPDARKALLLARLFKSAATLYGMLSLSLYKPSIAADKVDSSAEACDIQRISQRGYLLSLIREGMHILTSTTPLCWPLAVAGVALADGTAAEQTIVIECLQRICLAPETYRGPMVLLSRLQQFWSSGMARWEDCFDRPYTVLG